MSHTNRVVVLIDMDCFYCQVEEKLNPALEGKPIAVVQYNAWRGGGIIAVNYPAREKGVTRHMRGNQAKEICPDLILARVPDAGGKADLTKYRDAGKRVADVLQMFTGLLERASVDEAYLDITEEVDKRLQQEISNLTIQKIPNTFVVGYETIDFIESIRQNPDLMESDTKLAMGAVITEEIRAEVLKQTGYKCSAGVAHNKILAKLVCGLHKPNKQTVLPHNSVPELYKDLPIQKIKSLGGKFGNSITNELQIATVGELIQFSEKELARKFDNKTAKWLYNLARGVDLEPVTTRLISKSIGCCKKFPGVTALKTSEDVEHWLDKLCEEISERLQKDLEENNRKAKQMVVSFSHKVDKEIINSSRNHPLNGYDKTKIAQGAMDVIRRYCMKADRTYHVTFLGVSVGNFQPLQNSTDISLLFKNMHESNSKRQEEKSKIKNNGLKFSDSVENSNVNKTEGLTEGNNSKFSKTNMENSFFARFLKDNPELNNPKIESNLPVNEQNSHSTDKNLQSSKPKTNSFFERFFKENPEFITDAKKKEPNVSNDENSVDELKGLGNDEFEVDSCSVYSASTEELEEDTRNLIYFEDVFSEADSCKPIFRSSEENQEKPSTSRTGSFFLNYLKNEGMIKEETEITNEINETDNDNVEGLCSPMVEQENKVHSTVMASSSADGDNQKCPECNKKILNSDLISHMDYHFALKIVKEEAHLYKNSEGSDRKSQVMKSVKKPGMKRKKFIESNSKSIVAFFQKPDDGISEDNSDLCIECNKRIKIEDIASHMDYHIAKKLHCELNSNLQNSKKNSTVSGNVKNKKSKVVNNRTVSTFFKNDN